MTVYSAVTVDGRSVDGKIVERDSFGDVIATRYAKTHGEVCAIAAKAATHLDCKVLVKRDDGTIAATFLP